LDTQVRVTFIMKMENGFLEKQTKTNT
jgi:hypothetical protein